MIEGNYTGDFEKDGFAILKGFYSEAEVDAVVREIEALTSTRPLNVVVDMLDNGERTLLGLLSDEEVSDRRMKINDLFLELHAVRELALSLHLSASLRELLGHQPVLCNSLYFEKGSAQPPHVDALYMTPATPGHLIATWVALEDVHVDAGPLEYFPGSHLIDRFVFSTGSHHFVPDEMNQWHAYIAAALDRRGLKKQTFAAKKGDVFVWSADLVHGGAPINNLELTRKSLVFHYFSKSDSERSGAALEPMAQGYWMNRPTQAVSAEIAARAQSEREKRVAA